MIVSKGPLFLYYYYYYYYYYLLVMSQEKAFFIHVCLFKSVGSDDAILLFDIIFCLQILSTV